MTTSVVVVTGATEGIGRALAERFARAGNALLLVARDEQRLGLVAGELTAAHGAQVFTTPQDLSTGEGCAGVAAALNGFDLHAQVLVNNAGITSAGFFQDEDPEIAAKIVDLDARAVMDLTRRLLPGMLARGEGGVLNVGSMVGFMPVPYQATYAAANAFVLSFTRALAYETMGTGVRISLLAPGPVITRLHAKGGATHSRYMYFLPVMTPEQVAETAYRQFQRGKKIIVPGLLNRLCAFFTNFVPYLLLMPAMGFLFRVRDAEGVVQQPGVLPQEDQR